MSVAKNSSGNFLDSTVSTIVGEGIGSVFGGIGTSFVPSKITKKQEIYLEYENFRDQGKYEEAIVELDKLLKLDIDSDTYYNLLAYKSKCYLELKQLSKAEKVADSMIKEKPDWYIGYNHLANICTEKGEKEKALKFHIKANQIKSNSNSLLNLGIAFYHKENYDIALDYLLRSYKKTKTIQTLEWICQTLYREKKFELALNSCLKGLDFVDKEIDKCKKILKLYDKEPKTLYRLEQLRKSAKRFLGIKWKSRDAIKS